MSRPTFLVPPPVLAAAAGLLQHRLARGRSSSRLSRIAAALLAASSLGLDGAAMGGFRRESTTVDPIHPDRASALVTTGAFGFTRNPMYVGIAGLLLSHAVLRRSWASLIPVAAFVLAVDRLQVRAEEAALADRFGADYEAYRARVPRWIGPPATR